MMHGQTQTKFIIFYNIWYSVLLIWQAGVLSAAAWHYVYGMKEADDARPNKNQKYISFILILRIYCTDISRCTVNKILKMSEVQ
jgi:hypothetical protein